MTTTTTPKPRGRWIPWVFLGGFATVVAVNAVLITAAVRTYAGTTTVGAYDRGRGYAGVLAEAERQRALGWQGEAALRDGAVLLSVLQRDGSPLPADAEVSGVLQRPLERARVALLFQPSGPGLWRAAGDTLAAGAWDAVLTVTRGTDRLEFRERLVVR